jgi:hypothetical protein
MSAQLKQYLGDSVYADCDGFGITLTTENGDGPSNTIYLEPEVLNALDRYRKWLKEPELEESES